MNKHTHTPIKQAVFIIILLTALAWLTLAASDSGGAETPARTTETTVSTTTTTSTTLPPTTTTIIPPTTTTFINRTEVSVTGNPSPPTVTTGQYSRKCRNEAAQLSPEIKALVHVHFDEFGPAEAEWMITTVWCESNGRPDAQNPSGCKGLTQLALPTHNGLFTRHGWDPSTSWMDPDKNLTAAADLFRGYRNAGWNPHKPWLLPNSNDR